MRLLRLVFRVLGRAEGVTANPFADIASKSVVQTHRQEFSRDVLSRVCDAAAGEMKLLFFLGFGLIDGKPYEAWVPVRGFGLVVDAKDGSIL